MTNIMRRIFAPFKREGAVKAAVNSLIKAMMDRPGDFSISENRMKDTKTDYEYWISNGFMFAGVIEPYKLGFGLIQGWRFSRALANLKTYQLKTKTDAVAPAGKE